jgi:hypothetical protein
MGCGWRRCRHELEYRFRGAVLERIRRWVLVFISTPGLSGHPRQLTLALRMTAS